MSKEYKYIKIDFPSDGITMDGNMDTESIAKILDIAFKAEIEGIKMTLDLSTLEFGDMVSVECIETETLINKGSEKAIVTQSYFSESDGFDCVFLLTERGCDFGVNKEGYGYDTIYGSGEVTYKITAIHKRKDV